MNHQEVWEAEDTTPTEWEKWCDTIEQQFIGHTMDGWELQEAYDLWKAGWSPDRKTADVVKRHALQHDHQD
jgi:hypothetical protein